MNCLIEKNSVHRSGIRLAMFVVLVFGLALGAKSYARAADYYISSSQGNDSNSGTSLDTPWKSLSKIYSKSISENKFSPGDSILLKAGESHEGTISLYNAGTKDSPITIGRYGIGPNPIIYGDNPSVTWEAVDGDSLWRSLFLWRNSIECSHAMRVDIDLFFGSRKQLDTP